PDLRFERDLPAAPEGTVMQLDGDFSRMAVSHGRGPVEIRSVANGELLASLPASTNLPAHVARWSGSGRFLAVKRAYDTSGRRADLEVWEVAGARRVLSLRDVPWG